MIETDPLPLEIDAQALDAMRRAGVPLVLLDVREAWELTLCGFPEALHIPLATLPADHARVPSDRPVIVLCHHGQRSRIATEFLRRLGYAKAVNLRGGVEAWASDVDPAMPRY